MFYLCRWQARPFTPSTITYKSHTHPLPLKLKHNRLSADEALERVQRAFDTRKDNERRSPETDQQHQMVRDFVASLRK